MTRFALGFASLATVLALGSSALAFTGAMPSKAQEKQVTAQIQRNVQRTGWYKNLAKQGLKPTLQVSYGAGQAPKGMIGSGFPTATATVYAGKAMFGNGQQPQKQRQFTVEEKANGSFTATGGKWGQLYTLTAATK